MALQHQSTVITPPTHHLLPNEIMALIFSSVTYSHSTLYQYTLVNKSFYEAFNPALWHSPQLINKNMTTRFFKGMLDMSKQRCDTLGQLIHELRLNHDYPTDDPSIDPLRSQDDSYIRNNVLSVPKIQVLDDEDRLPLSNLQQLTLSNCFGRDILRHLPNHSRLTCIKLEHALVAKEGFEALSQCPLEDFEWTTDGREWSGLLQYLNACPLRRLAIHFLPSRWPMKWYITNSQIPISFNTLMMDSSTFLQLTVLELHQCPDINDAVLTAFFNHHPLLEQLHLSYQDITDATLDAIKLPRLTRTSLINMPHITTAAVRRLMTACPLTYLDVSHCAKVNIAGFPDFVVKRQMHWNQVRWTSS